VITELKRQLKAEEGVRACVYPDSLSFWSIGVGRLVDSRKPGAGLRPDEIDYLLSNDIQDRIDALTRALPWFQNLDDARKAVLIGMAFQLGTAGVLAFKNMLAAIQVGKYEDAAVEMLDSTWAKQTPARANRLAQQMKTGAFVFAPGA
jgi:lysozyme